MTRAAAPSAIDPASFKRLLGHFSLEALPPTSFATGPDGPMRFIEVALMFYLHVSLGRFFCIHIAFFFKVSSGYKVPVASSSGTSPVLFLRSLVLLFGPIEIFSQSYKLGLF